MQNTLEQIRQLEQTSLFYTLSTIAQVLGSTIALSGVFVLFKLQEIHKRKILLADNFNRAINSITGLEPDILAKVMAKKSSIANMLLFDQTEGILEHMKNIFTIEGLEISKEQIPYFNANYFLEMFDYLCFLKDTILKFTKWSVLSGIITIYYSVTVIHYISSYRDDLYNYLVLFSIVGVGFSLISMVAVMYYSVKEIKIVG